jgi:hypothetical protein
MRTLILDVAVADANAHRLPQCQVLCRQQSLQRHLSRHLPHIKPPPPTEITLMLAKQTRKAARRRCEVELLREIDSEEELQLSPVDQTHQSPPIDSPPSQMPLSTPALALSLTDFSVSLPAASPSPISIPATSLLPAGSPVGKPPSPHSPTSSPTPPTSPAQP